MRTLLLLAFSLLSSGCVLSQLSPKHDWSSSKTILSLGAKGLFVHPFPINNLSPYSQKSNQKYYASYGAIIVSSLAINRKFGFDGTLNYHYISPITAIIGDESSALFRGYHVGLDFGVDMLRKFEKIDLVVGFGFETGRYKVVINDYYSPYDEWNYRRPFFSPKLSVTPRFQVWNLILSLRTEAMLDISNKSWKKTPSETFDFPKIAASGINFEVSLGYCFN